MRLDIKNPLSVLLILFVLVSCKNKKEAQNDVKDIAQEENLVEVITTGMDFKMVEQVKSGWTTFKYVNNSPETHFFVLEKMPDTLGIYTYRRELFPPFLAAFEHFQKGEMEAGMQEFEKIPEWFYKVELAGGAGLTSKRTVSKTTVFLEPGTYVMECYVRMPNGLPHTFMGMIHELKVTNETNGQDPPKADHSIVVSSEMGLKFVDSLEAGKYTLAAKFEDQKQYEHLMGHDVNLVKIDHDSLIPTLGNWLNAANFAALRTPQPQGLKFYGGVEELPAGKTGYFEVELEEGNYVLISEIPDAIDRNMIKAFTVY